MAAINKLSSKKLSIQAAHHVLCLAGFNNGEELNQMSDASLMIIIISALLVKNFVLSQF